MGPGMALEEQDPGLVLAGVARESGVEAARGVGPVGQTRVGVCGSSSVAVALDLARDLEAEVRVEAPEQGAVKALEAAAWAVRVQGVEAAAAQAPAGPAAPVADLVGLVQVTEGLQAVGVRERAFLENG